MVQLPQEAPTYTKVYNHCFASVLEPGGKNPLGGVKPQALPGFSPRGFDSAGLGWAQDSAFLANSGGILMLQAPELEEHMPKSKICT